MDQRPLAPGEVRFDVAAPPPKPPRQMSAKWAIGLFAVFALVIGYLSHKFPDGYPPKPASETVQVPEPPTPPGSYAVFSERGAPGQAGNPQSIGFVHERVLVLRVPPNEIPDIDRARAANNGRNPTAPVTGNGTPGGKSVVLASHFDSPLYAAVRAANDKAHGRIAEATLPPYILHGDVDITCGDLSHDDAGYATVLLENGDLSRAGFHLADGTPRGPPVPVRTVYIMGDVRDVHGPEQYQRSVLLDRTLDLGPTDTSSEEYKHRLEDWNKEIIALEARLHVPAKELRAYAGARIEVRSGEIIGAIDKDGRKMEEPSEIKLDREIKRLDHLSDPKSESGEHTLEERQTEHPVEHGIP